MRLRAEERADDPEITTKAFCELCELRNEAEETADCVNLRAKHGRGSLWREEPTVRTGRNPKWTIREQAHQKDYVLCILPEVSALCPVALLSCVKTN